MNAQTLVNAIHSRDHQQIQNLLLNPSFPVNLFAPGVHELPLSYALKSGDARILKAFMQCPRVDWFKANRCDLHELKRVGFEIDGEVEELQEKQLPTSKVANFPSVETKETSFLPKIYDFLFAQLTDEPVEQLRLLPLKVKHYLPAFADSLKLCGDLNSRHFPKERTLLLELLASGYCSVEHVKLLIEAGAEVNATDVTGKSALMYAFDKFFVTWPIIEVLVEAGADLGAIDGSGRTAFAYCKEVSGYLDRFPLHEADLRCFLKFFNKTDFNFKCVQQKYPNFCELVSDWISLEGIASSSHMKALIGRRFAGGNHLSFLKSWIASGDAYNASIFPQLHQVITKNAIELLIHAIRHQNRSFYREFLSNATKYRINATPALFQSRGNHELIKLSLAAGADPEASNEHGKFYHQSGFQLTNEAVPWMQKLFTRPKGFAFERSPVDGSSVFDVEGVELTIGDVTITSKCSNELCQQLCSPSLDWKAPIDLEGNTLLHHYAQGFLKTSQVFGFKALKEAINYSSVTAYDLLTPGVREKELIFSIADGQEVGIPGKSVIRRCTGKLLLAAASAQICPSSSRFPFPAIESSSAPPDSQLSFPAN